MGHGDDAVRDYGVPLVNDPDRLQRVRALGVDETAFLAATPTSGTAFATGIVALNGRARLLDVVPGRSAHALSALSCVEPDKELQHAKVQWQQICCSERKP